MLYISLVTHRHTRAGGYPFPVGCPVLLGIKADPISATVGGCSAICSCIALLPTSLSEPQATPKKLWEGARAR